MIESPAGIPAPQDAADEDAQRALFATLYNELRNIARRELRRGAPLTLSPTTLLHEAFFKLQQRDGTPFADRAHFLAYSARVMRSLVIDFARRRQAQKRGGAYEITNLPTAVPDDAAQAEELESLAGAIDTLGTLDPALAELVNLKFFCGLSFVEIAAMRSVSERTVLRDWEKSRILLKRALEGRELIPS